MKKIIATIVGAIMALLGLLWFLQGADILHIRPILCFADCEYIAGGSWVWEIAGVFAFAIGGAILILFHTPWINWPEIFRLGRQRVPGTEKTSQISSASLFFILVFALSIPFNLLGISGARIPGLSYLPTSSFMTFVPMIAAMILVYRQLGRNGIKALAKRVFDVNRLGNAGWVLVAFLFMLVVSALEFVFLRFAGMSLPLAQITPGAAGFAFIIFFIGAIGEELGWQGYAYPMLRKKHSALVAALILGVIWALWHVIPYVQLGHDLNWIFWQVLCTIALRIIIVWLYENTHQSVFVAVLFHTMINVSWVVFPVSLSYEHPLVTFLLVACAAGLVVFFQGFKSLKQTAPSGFD